MNIVEAFILGIVQGLTEFLPISSTGHLTLAGKLMGLITEDNPEQWTAFIAVIQLGTLLAVLIFFRNDIVDIIKEFISDNIIGRKRFKEQSLNSKMGWFLLIATIPVVIVGLGFKDLIEGVFTKNLYVISISLIVLALFLAVAERVSRLNRDSKSINWLDSLIIGIAQSLALIPGASRSGTTITAGLFLGFNRATAARFSFLMSIPAILASGLLQFYQAMEYIDFISSINLLTATVVSGIVGYLSIEFLLRFLRKNSTMVFIIYRIVIGSVILFLIANGIIQA